MSPRCALSGALAALLASAAPALGSPQFGRPQQFARAEFFTTPSVAAGPGAALTFAYRPDEPNGDGLVRGTWRPGQPLVAPHHVGRNIVTSVSIASSRRGVVAVAWIESHFGSDRLHRVRVAVKPPGRPFGAARTVAVVSDPADPKLKVAVADDRTVAVVWTNRPDFHSERSQVAVRWPGHAFTSPIRLTRPDRDTSDLGPQIAVSRGGHVLAAWTDSDEAVGNGTLRVARIAGGRLKHVTTLTPGVDRAEAAFRLVANPAGRVALGWTVDAGRRRTARLAIGTTRAGLGKPRSLSRGRTGRLPVPAFGPRGELAVAWFEQSPDDVRSLVAVNSLGRGRFTSPHQLDVGDLAAPQLAVDAAGRPSVIWRNRSGEGEVVRTATAARRAAFGAPQTFLATKHSVPRTELRASGGRTVGLAIEDGGNARGGNGRLWSTLRAGSPGFGPPRLLARTSTGDISFTTPGLVTYGNGGFIAVFHTISHTNFDDRLRASVLRP